MVLAACSGTSATRAPGSADLYRGGEAPHSRAADRSMIDIPAGRFVAGSTPEERAQGYGDYLRTAAHDGAREGKWFDREEDRHVVDLPGYAIDLTPVTNAAYAEFIADTGRTAPAVDAETWTSYGFTQDYDAEVARFNWSDGQPPPGRADHPVVLVTWHDAHDYCAWRGDLIGATRRLPTAHEYERAARGDDGLAYPWGQSYEATLLNDRVRGPGDTVSVGSFSEGVSPHGMLDAAGNVFEWTATPWPGDDGSYTVKGSAWDDYAGVGRPAQRHGRRADIRHAIIGFRCAADL